MEAVKIKIPFYIGSEVDFGTLSIFGPRNKSKEHLSLAEITAVCRLGGDKTLGIFTSARSQTLTPIQLRFSGDIELEGWQAHLVAGVNSVRRCTGGPTPGKCVFSVTSRGEVCIFDAQAAENESGGVNGSGSGDQQIDCAYSQEIPCRDRPLPLLHPLENGFPPGSEIFASLRIKPIPNGGGSAEHQFALNLNGGKMSTDDTSVALHFNPRLKEAKNVVINDRSGH